MLEKVFGIIGIALAIIFGLLPLVDIALPIWISILGIGLGVLLLGIAMGIYLGDKLHRNVKYHAVDKALLRLHIYQDHRIPESLEMLNIFRWYYLSYIHQTIDKGGNILENELPTLFISFSPEVKITNLKVRSPNINMPRYEVKEFNQKFAIVVFSNKLGEGTLEIAVEP